MSPKTLEELPRIIKEAFHLARSGRPGPVLVDIPKDIQQQVGIPNFDEPMSIIGYMNRLPKPLSPWTWRASTKPSRRPRSR